MEITINLYHSQLGIINGLMEYLDTTQFQGQPRHLKSIYSICLELRETLLQKAIKVRNKPQDTKFKLKLSYYKADALFCYLTNYRFLYPSIYEKNLIEMIVRDLHQKLL